jgi:hypothetical protein
VPESLQPIIDRLFGHLIMVVSMLQSNIMNAFNYILI